MPFDTLAEALDLVYRSYNAARPLPRATDDVVRAAHPAQARELLARVGHPERGVDHVLVVGSKGKGSTAALLASLLTAAGAGPVGLFTSPHLVSPLERVRVDGRAVPERLFLDAVGAVAPHVEALERSVSPGSYLSPLAVYLAAASLCFRSLGVRLAVLEAGRGGMLDPVNAVPHRWAVITEVFAEHVDALGPTLADIARHKAGVIGPGVREVVCGASHPGVRRVVAARCRAVGARLVVHGEDLHVEEAGGGREGVAGTVAFSDGARFPFRLGLEGGFQLRNAALAVAGARAVLGRLDPDGAERALARVRLPGRCEVTGGAPEVMVDGAIHRRSARYVVEVVRARRRLPVVAVLAVPASKDHGGVLAEVGRVASTCILTRPGNPAGFSFPVEAPPAIGRGAAALRVAPLAAALEVGRSLAGPGGMVLVVGTQVAVGETLALLGRDCGTLWDR